MAFTKKGKQITIISHTVQPPRLPSQANLIYHVPQILLLSPIPRFNLRPRRWRHPRLRPRDQTPRPRNSCSPARWKSSLRACPPRSSSLTRATTRWSLTRKNSSGIARPPAWAPSKRSRTLVGPVRLHTTRSLLFRNSHRETYSVWD